LQRQDFLMAGCRKDCKCKTDNQHT
jgi:hypothetical protein